MGKIKIEGKIRTFPHNGLIYIVAVVTIFLMHMFYNIKDYLFDSELYWSLGYTFDINEFNFTNYSNSLRGYFLPFIHYILIKLASIGIGTERINLWLFHSLFYAFIIVVVFPGLIKKLFNIEKNKWATIVFLFIFCFFFKGIILYPVSDVVAFGFFVIGCWCIACVQRKGLLDVLCSIMAGFFLGGAYSIRPVYLIAILGYIVLVLYKIMLKKQWLLILGFIGIFIISIPQMLINIKHFDSYSPLIQTENYYGGKSLYLHQLEWGITNIRYETNLDLEAFDSCPMPFYDEIGAKILDNQIFSSYFDYIKFVISHFFDVAIIYIKHFFAGIDIIWTNCYIPKLFINRFWIQLLNYTLIFWGFIGIKKYMSLTSYNSTNIGLSIIYILPILLVVPTAVETRFFIGCNTLFYYFACRIFFDKNNFRDVFCAKKNYVHYVIFILICYIINNSIIEQYSIPLW